MTVPDPPPPIRLPADIWQLDAKPAHLEDSARAWRTAGEASVDCGDRLVEATRTLLGSEWAGPARDSFARHQASLVSTLDDAKSEAADVALTLERWAGLLRLTQATLDGEFEEIVRRVGMDNGRTPVAGEEVVFRPGSPGEVNAVNAAVKRALGIKAELEAILADEFSNFDNGEWATLASKWLGIAEGTQRPFTLPPEADGTSVLMVDGRAIVNTGTGDDDVRVTIDPDTGEVIVTVNGDEHRYPAGTPVTIRGGEGNDTINIPKDTNVRVTLLGGAGDDIIQGGAGNEVIIGGRGRDEIFAGAGHDYASGGAGDDYIDGQSHGDRIGGGLGRDVLYGLGGRDYLSGGEGDDYLEGGKHRDELQGGAGQDVVSGGRGLDTMSGGTGNDVMYGGQGRDNISGGGGTDTAYRQTNDSVSGVSGRNDILVEISGDYGHIKIDGTPEFQARILADLEMYRASPTGQQMLEELADSRDPNWGIGSNHLEIREFDVDNGLAEGNPEVSGHNNSVVSINPEFTLDGDVYAPPSVILYHEFGHVYDQWNDTRSGDTHSGGLDDGVNEAERQATGLPIDHDDDDSTPKIIDPDHPKVYTENAMREEMGIETRDSYANDGI